MIASPNAPLLSELRWFVLQRWGAAAVVILSVLAYAAWGGWSATNGWILAVGVAILLCNAGYWVVLRRPGSLADETHQRVFAWAQMVLDLACLTALAMLTGGALSPLLGLFVLHMIFASLLLQPPRYAAYAAWGVAVAMMGLALALHGDRLDTTPERLVALSWAGTLLLTVFFTSHITGALQALNAELTRHQAHLIQQEKMVAVGQMASGVAHEIANPLANMDGLLQLVARNPDRMSPETLHELREQIKRITHIAHQLKDYAHPSQIERRTITPAELIDSATDMIRFDKRHHSIVIEPPPDDNCHVRVHTQSMQQVLVNVIINALDATDAVDSVADRDEPRVAVSARLLGSTVCQITVADNGVGLSPEQAAQAFEPFFTTKPLGQGTGLGLSISENLVRREGGTIELASEPGRGATLTISLPLAHPSA
ncbi:MAG: signal transduction histidine kinase [Phycisphaerales bacterium]|jgi:signal transduction histidine kinase